MLVDELHLKHLSRHLIELCGGQVQAAANCRLKSARLAMCSSDEYPGHFLPMDVVADLEAFCGEQVISKALVEARPWRPDPVEPMPAAINLVVTASVALDYVSRTERPGRPRSLNERVKLHELVSEVEARLRELRASIGGEA